MKAVLIHEWLTNRAGSEQVVAALRRAFPGAPVYTSMRWRPEFPDWDPVHTSFLQPLARGPASHIPALPLMPAAFRSLRVPRADVVVTSFHTFALWARVPPGVPHIAYCHTPPRFIWASAQLGNETGVLGGRALRLAGAALARADTGRGRRPDVIVANSAAVAQRILEAYGRPAPVIHPPVDIERFTKMAGTPVGDYFLVVSRLVPYKRVDLAVAAFAELGWPLRVVGTGRQAAELRSGAPGNVEFLGRVPDDALPSLVAGARALILPGEEDFGIAAVEAMAAGTPVVALGRGGARETVVEDLSGVLFSEPTTRSLAAAVRRAATATWDVPAMTAWARGFDEDHFRSAMLGLAAEVTASGKSV